MTGETAVRTKVGEPPAEGRSAKKRRATRVKLLKTAHRVMTQVGIDDAKIKDITDLADVGFGTFYNYFDSKDHLASQVLDCVIDDIGRRNLIATAGLPSSDVVVSRVIRTRLVLRTAMSDPLWRWWALRPDLLFDRMTVGFGRFARQDIRDTIVNGRSSLHLDEVDAGWNLAVWVMVGGIHDVVVGKRTPDCEAFVAEAVMRLLGSDSSDARAAASTVLPQYPESDIDWEFSL